MAAFALIAEKITINSVDMSQYIKSAALTVDGAQLDSTDFASGGWTEMIGGLKSGTLAITWNDDIVTSTVDDRLWALFNTVTTFAIKATTAATGASNPEYQGSVLVSSLSFGGAVGDLASKQTSWNTSGPVTRAVV